MGAVNMRGIGHKLCYGKCLWWTTNSAGIYVDNF